MLLQAAVVRDAHKAYVRETAIPKALAQRIAKLETDAYVVGGCLASVTAGTLLTAAHALLQGCMQRRICKQQQDSTKRGLSQSQWWCAFMAAGLAEGASHSVPLGVCTVGPWCCTGAVAHL
jgi:hypothetical protein